MKINRKKLAFDAVLLHQQEGKNRPDKPNIMFPILYSSLKHFERNITFIGLKYILSSVSQCSSKYDLLSCLMMMGESFGMECILWKLWLICFPMEIFQKHERIKVWNAVWNVSVIVLNPGNVNSRSWVLIKSLVLQTVLAH